MKILNFLLQPNIKILFHNNAVEIIDLNSSNKSCTLHKLPDEYNSMIYQTMIHKDEYNKLEVFNFYGFEFKEHNWNYLLDLNKFITIDKIQNIPSNPDYIKINHIQLEHLENFFSFFRNKFFYKLYNEYKISKTDKDLLEGLL